MSSPDRVEKRCASCLRVVGLADDYCSEKCRQADDEAARLRLERGSPLVDLVKLRDDNVVMARERAHAVFDLLELLRFMTRDEAYAWLAEVLHLEKREAHIGRLNPEQCNRLVEICRVRIQFHVNQLRARCASVEGA